MTGYSLAYSRAPMWEIDPGHLLAAMERANINQSQLAEMVGVKQPSIGRLLSGETKTTRALDLIASALKTSPAYLKGETDDPAAGAVSDQRLAFFGKQTNRDPDTVELTEFDVAYGMGTSYIHDVPVTGRQRIFSRSWIRQFTDAPMESLFWATGNGTSMVPAILDSDILLIDTAQRTPRMWDQFWAIDMHGMGMIKALRPGKDGAMRILSINPDWPEELAYDGEMNVIGRVVAIVRKC